ncbi:MAG: aminopeptidase P family protein [Clostridia bacterium]|nr:aminopeptidase P family protein [Clostridia bacterium]
MLPQGVDAAVINDSDIRFRLTGFRSSAGTLVLHEKKCTLFVDFRYIEAAKAAVGEENVVLTAKLYDQLKTLFDELNAKNIAFLDDKVTVAESRRLTAVFEDYHCIFEPELSALLTREAMIKSPHEQQMMKQAQAITDGAFTAVLGYIRPGMTEREIALFLENHVKQHGAEGMSFDSIVVSGANSSKPHGVPTDKRVEQGDFITMDFGVKYAGYCSDMTRTVCVGQPTDEMRSVYELVLRAQQAAIAAIRPGMLGRDVDKIARDMIYEAGYEGRFGHGLGHGVGVLIHEEPRFSPGDETVLQPGMVLSVEPGVYLPGKFGVRIEDVIIVTEDGCEDITSSRKELICL